MKWFAVRTIFHFGIKDDGKNVFEERTVVFSGETAEEAFKKADVEAEEYSKCDGRDDLAIHPSKELYIQDGDPLIDGYEVWSQLFETTETMEVFCQNRYERYEYTPN